MKLKKFTYPESKKLGNKFLNLNKKHYLIVVSTVLFLTVIFLFFLQSGILNKESKSNKQSFACTSNTTNIVKDSYNLFAPEKHKDLKIIVDKIYTLSDYDKDPNCLFIITMYYANISDSTNARLNYDKLIIFTSQKNISVLSTAFNMETLKSKLEYAENFNEQIKENALFGPKVEQ